MTSEEALKEIAKELETYIEKDKQDNEEDKLNRLRKVLHIRHLINQIDHDLHILSLLKYYIPEIKRNKLNEEQIESITDWLKEDEENGK